MQVFQDYSRNSMVRVSFNERIQDATKCLGTGKGKGTQEELKRDSWYQERDLLVREEGLVNNKAT